MMDFFLQFKPLIELTFIRTSGKIINPIDVKQIKKKSADYQSFNELREDVSWLRHNCEVYHKNSRKIMNATKELVKFIDDEISIMKNCTECYQNAYENPKSSATMPCSLSHPVVWAKTDGFTYWPAKAVAFDGKVVHVIYFNEHTTSKVLTEKCYAFSATPPEATQNYADAYEDAIQVRNQNKILITISNYHYVL